MNSKTYRLHLSHLLQRTVHAFLEDLNFLVLLLAQLLKIVSTLVELLSLVLELNLFGLRINTPTSAQESNDRQTGDATHSKRIFELVNLALINVRHARDLIPLVACGILQPLIGEIEFSSNAVQLLLLVLQCEQLVRSPPHASRLADSPTSAGPNQTWPDRVPVSCRRARGSSP